MLKRLYYFFATLVLCRQTFLVSCLLAVLSFGFSNALANPTQKQEIKKIKPELNESQKNELELEKKETLSPTTLSQTDQGGVRRSHLVKNHYNLGLALKAGKFFKDQSNATSIGGYFSATQIVDIQKAYDLNLSIFTTGWWQVMLGQRTYFSDTPYFRPYYGFAVGTQLHPNEKIGSLIVYERYSAGAKIGLEGLFRELAYHLEGESMVSLIGINLQANFSIQKSF